MNKIAVENRLTRVVDYTGTHDLPGVVTKAMIGAKVYMAEWVVAHACMTPQEFIDFGNHGKSWKYLDKKPETAMRLIETSRRVVERQCRRIGYDRFVWDEAYR